jgi:branched-chain amino acid transport system substrate-binding protein
MIARPLAAGLMLGLALVAPRAAQPADYELHAILPLTGNASFLGREQQDLLRILEPSINQSGGIAGRNLRFVFHDDQTSPQVALQLANEVLASHPAIMLGPSITAECAAVAPLMQDGPVMYCLSPGILPPPGGYVFSASVQTEKLNLALIRYFRMKGWTKIAMLSSIDATGQDADRGVDRSLALPENAGVTLTEHVHFTATDVSVTAQIERIKASGAQALIAWTTGAQVATIFKAMIQAGLDIPVGTSPGNQEYEQLAQYVEFLPRQLVIPSCLYPEHEGVYRLDPRVEKVQHEMYDLLAAAHRKSDNAVGTAWDPALITVDALRRLGPDADATQIRQTIADQSDFPGVNGIYDFKKVPQRGIDVDDIAIVRFDPQRMQWVWLSKPGGEPLQR